MVTHASGKAAAWTCGLVGVVAGLASIVPSALLLFHAIGARFGRTCWMSDAETHPLATLMFLAGSATALLSIVGLKRGDWRHGTIALVMGLMMLLQHQTLYLAFRSGTYWPSVILEDVGFEVVQRARELGTFPLDHAEVRKCVMQSVGTFHGRKSPFWCNGTQLPYEVEVRRGALGPVLSTDGLSPGMIVYSVSDDGDRYWATIVVLDDTRGKELSMLQNEYDQILVEEGFLDNGMARSVKGDDNW